MRRENISKFLFIATITLAVLMVFNIVALRAIRRQYSPGAFAGASLFNIAGQAREWLGYLKQWKDLSTENARLRGLVAHYVSTTATIESLQAENDALKKTAGLATRLGRHLLPAGIFDISLSPVGYHALINKGSTSGVITDQIVISPAGELIGEVVAVFPTSAQVMLVTDPAFSVTARVLGGQTSGIVRGALADGMNFDFITQADSILEGDTIVTTGDDLIPAGLVIGTVRRVENNDTQLFKKVSINPSIQPGQGPIVVIQ
jgi:rod shape-determining protein MreC